MRTSHTIRTSAGAVVGSESGDTIAFLGIPFALAPTGNRRFRAPEPHPRWEEPFVADHYGDSPIQVPSPYTAGMVLSEDCLSLNIWVPDGARDSPVVMWIYGGGFEGGSSSSPIFDGARLAAESGIVVVSANHRTGVLGFASLTHRGLPDASNLGVRDVVSALEWIRENIVFFGGDPSQVTVMGQSSGAFIAAALLAAPTARGLFNKLVLISGGASRIVPQQQAALLGDRLVKATRVVSGPQLLGLAADELLSAQRRICSHEIGRRNAPIPDALGVVLDREAPNPVLDKHPLDAIRSGEVRHVPILFVVAGAEVASLRGPDSEFVPRDDQATIDEIASWGAIDAERINADYGDGELGAKREQILTDFIYRLPAARAAIAHNASGGRAWIAQVDRPDGSAAGHDLPPRILFGNLPDDDPLTEVSGLLRGIIAEFITYGEATWAEFDSAGSAVMRLSRRATPMAHDFEPFLHRWEGVERP